MKSKLLEIIIKSQNTDGSWDGWVSSNPYNFKRHKTHNTSFFTAVILSCLSSIEHPIKIKAADFLDKQQSKAGSWNYWSRDAHEASARPYPDDLDDTAYALIALHLNSPKAVSGAQIAKFSKLLIETEEEPGGPYRTWLVDDASKEIWLDVDIAVNANIGYFLHLNDVSLPRLDEYFSEKFSAGDFQSRYYFGEMPTLYFLSKWKNKVELLTAIQAHSAAAQDMGVLENALLTTARQRLGISSNINMLVKKIEDHGVKAEAFYFEPPSSGEANYAGSDALTAAFCLEALLFEEKSEGAKTKANRGFSFGSLPDEIRLAASGIAARIIENDPDGQAFSIAETANNAFQGNVAIREIENLNEANLLGWVAYKIYDDIWDEGTNTGLLSVANICQRESLNKFMSGVNDPNYKKYVFQAFNDVDLANRWEQQKARFTASPDKIPDYGDLGQLARRSWGHVLAPMRILMGIGYKLTDSEVLQFQAFFKHYLIARQLLDDAHDIEADLAHGHINSVAAYILGRANTVNTLEEDWMYQVRKSFWQENLGDVVGIIKNNVKLARSSLEASGAIKEPGAFAGWLDRIDNSAEVALSEKNRAEDFINEFAALE